jgi:hypothetical protein
VLAADRSPLESSLLTARHRPLVIQKCRSLDSLRSLGMTGDSRRSLGMTTDLRSLGMTESMAEAASRFVTWLTAGRQSH